MPDKNKPTIIGPEGEEGNKGGKSSPTTEDQSSIIDERRSRINELWNQYQYSPRREDIYESYLTGAIVSEQEPLSEFTEEEAMAYETEFSPFGDIGKIKSYATAYKDLASLDKNLADLVRGTLGKGITEAYLYGGFVGEKKKRYEELRDKAMNSPEDMTEEEKDELKGMMVMKASMMIDPTKLYNDVNRIYADNANTMSLMLWSGQLHYLEGLYMSSFDLFGMGNWGKLTYEIGLVDSSLHTKLNANTFTGRLMAMVPHAAQGIGQATIPIIASFISGVIGAPIAGKIATAVTTVSTAMHAYKSAEQESFIKFANEWNPNSFASDAFRKSYEIAMSIYADKDKALEYAKGVFKNALYAEYGDKTASQIYSEMESAANASGIASAVVNGAAQYVTGLLAMKFGGGEFTAKLGKYLGVGKNIGSASTARMAGQAAQALNAIRMAPQGAFELWSSTLQRIATPLTNVIGRGVAPRIMLESSFIEGIDEFFQEAIENIAIEGFTTKGILEARDKIKHLDWQRYDYTGRYVGYASMKLADVRDRYFMHAWIHAFTQSEIYYDAMFAAFSAGLGGIATGGITSAIRKSNIKRYVSRFLKSNSDIISEQEKSSRSNDPSNSDKIKKGMKLEEIKQKVYNDTAKNFITDVIALEMAGSVQEVKSAIDKHLNSKRVKRALGERYEEFVGGVKSVVDTILSEGSLFREKLQDVLDKNRSALFSLDDKKRESALFKVRSVISAASVAADMSVDFSKAEGEQREIINKETFNAVFSSQMEFIDTVTSLQKEVGGQPISEQERLSFMNVENIEELNEIADGNGALPDGASPSQIRYIAFRKMATRMTTALMGDNLDISSSEVAAASEAFIETLNALQGDPSEDNISAMRNAAKRLIKAASEAKRSQYSDILSKDPKAEAIYRRSEEMLMSTLDSMLTSVSEGKNPNQMAAITAFYSVAFTHHVLSGLSSSYANMSVGKTNNPHVNRYLEIFGSLFTDRDDNPSAASPAVMSFNRHLRRIVGILDSVGKYADASQHIDLVGHEDYDNYIEVLSTSQMKLTNIVQLIAKLFMLRNESGIIAAMFRFTLNKILVVELMNTGMGYAQATEIANTVSAHGEAAQPVDFAQLLRDPEEGNNVVGALRMALDGLVEYTEDHVAMEFQALVRGQLEATLSAQLSYVNSSEFKAEMLARNSWLSMYNSNANQMVANGLVNEAIEILHEDFEIEVDGEVVETDMDTIHRYIQEIGLTRARALARMIRKATVEDKDKEHFKKLRSLANKIDDIAEDKSIKLGERIKKMKEVMEELSPILNKKDMIRGMGGVVAKLEHVNMILTHALNISRHNEDINEVIKEYNRYIYQYGRGLKTLIRHTFRSFSKNWYQKKILMAKKISSIMRSMDEAARYIRLSEMMAESQDEVRKIKIVGIGTANRIAEYEGNVVQPAQLLDAAFGEYTHSFMYRGNIWQLRYESWVEERKTIMKAIVNNIATMADKIDHIDVAATTMAEMSIRNVMAMFDDIIHIITGKKIDQTNYAELFEQAFGADGLELNDIADGQIYDTLQHLYEMRFENQDEFETIRNRTLEFMLVEDQANAPDMENRDDVVEGIRDFIQRVTGKDGSVRVGHVGAERQSVNYEHINMEAKFNSSSKRRIVAIALLSPGEITDVSKYSDKVSETGVERRRKVLGGKVKDIIKNILSEFKKEDESQEFVDHAADLLYDEIGGIVDEVGETIGNLEYYDLLFSIIENTDAKRLYAISDLEKRASQMFSEEKIANIFKSLEEKGITLDEGRRKNIVEKLTNVFGDGRNWMSIVVTSMIDGVTPEFMHTLVGSLRKYNDSLTRLMLEEKIEEGKITALDVLNAEVGPIHSFMFNIAPGLTIEETNELNSEDKGYIAGFDAVNDYKVEYKEGKLTLRVGKVIRNGRCYMHRVIKREDGEYVSMEDKNVVIPEDHVQEMTITVPDGNVFRRAKSSPNIIRKLGLISPFMIAAGIDVNAIYTYIGVKVDDNGNLTIPKDGSKQEIHRRINILIDFVADLTDMLHDTMAANGGINDYATMAEHFAQAVEEYIKDGSGNISAINAILGTKTRFATHMVARAMFNSITPLKISKTDNTEGNMFEHRWVGYSFANIFDIASPFMKNTSYALNIVLNGTDPSGRPTARSENERIRMVYELTGDLMKVRGVSQTLKVYSTNDLHTSYQIEDEVNMLQTEDQNETIDRIWRFDMTITNTYKDDNGKTQKSTFRYFPDEPRSINSMKGVNVIVFSNSHVKPKIKASVQPTNSLLVATTGVEADEKNAMIISGDRMLTVRDGKLVIVPVESIEGSEGNIAANREFPTDNMAIERSNGQNKRVRDGNIIIKTEEFASYIERIDIGYQYEVMGSDGESRTDDLQGLLLGMYDKNRHIEITTEQEGDTVDIAVTTMYSNLLYKLITALESTTASFSIDEILQSFKDAAETIKQGYRNNPHLARTGMEQDVLMCATLLINIAQDMAADPQFESYTPIINEAINNLGRAIANISSDNIDDVFTSLSVLVERILTPAKKMTIDAANNPDTVMAIDALHEHIATHVATIKNITMQGLESTSQVDILTTRATNDIEINLSNDAMDSIVLAMFGASDDFVYSNLGRIVETAARDFLSNEEMDHYSFVVPVSLEDIESSTKRVLQKIEDKKLGDDGYISSVLQNMSEDMLNRMAGNPDQRAKNRSTIVEKQVTPGKGHPTKAKKKKTKKAKKAAAKKAAKPTIIGGETKKPAGKNIIEKIKKQIPKVDRKDRGKTTIPDKVKKLVAFRLVREGSNTYAVINERYPVTVQDVNGNVVETYAERERVFKVVKEGDKHKLVRINDEAEIKNANRLAITYKDSDFNPLGTVTAPITADQMTRSKSPAAEGRDLATINAVSEYVNGMTSSILGKAMLENMSEYAAARHENSLYNHTNMLESSYTATVTLNGSMVQEASDYYLTRSLTSGHARKTFNRLPQTSIKLNISEFVDSIKDVKEFEEHNIVNIMNELDDILSSFNHANGFLSHHFDTVMGFAEQVAGNGHAFVGVINNIRQHIESGGMFAANPIPLASQEAESLYTLMQTASHVMFMALYFNHLIDNGSIRDKSRIASIIKLTNDAKRLFAAVSSIVGVMTAKAKKDLKSTNYDPHLEVFNNNFMYSFFTSYVRDFQEQVAGTWLHNKELMEYLQTGGSIDDTSFKSKLMRDLNLIMETTDKAVEGGMADSEFAHMMAAMIRHSAYIHHDNDAVAALYGYLSQEGLEHAVLEYIGGGEVSRKGLKNMGIMRLFHIISLIDPDVGKALGEQIKKITQSTPESLGTVHASWMAILGSRPTAQTTFIKAAGFIGIRGITVLSFIDKNYNDGGDRNRDYLPSIASNFNDRLASGRRSLERDLRRLRNKLESISKDESISDEEKQTQIASINDRISNIEKIINLINKEGDNVKNILEIVIKLKKITTEMGSTNNQALADKIRAIENEYKDTIRKTRFGILFKRMRDALNVDNDVEYWNVVKFINDLYNTLHSAASISPKMKVDRGAPPEERTGANMFFDKKKEKQLADFIAGSISVKRKSMHYVHQGVQNLSLLNDMLDDLENIYEDGDIKDIGGIIYDLADRIMKSGSIKSSNMGSFIVSREEFANKFSKHVEGDTDKARRVMAAMLAATFGRDNVDSMPESVAKFLKGAESSNRMNDLSNELRDTLSQMFRGSTIFLHYQFDELGSQEGTNKQNISRITRHQTVIGRLSRAFYTLGSMLADEHRDKDVTSVKMEDRDIESVQGEFIAEYRKVDTTASVNVPHTSIYGPINVGDFIGRASTIVDASDTIIDSRSLTRNEKDKIGIKSYNKDSGSAQRTINNPPITGMHATFAQNQMGHIAPTRANSMATAELANILYNSNKESKAKSIARLKTLANRISGAVHQQETKRNVNRLASMLSALEKFVMGEGSNIMYDGGIALQISKGAKVKDVEGLKELIDAMSGYTKTAIGGVQPDLSIEEKDAAQVIGYVQAEVATVLFGTHTTHAGTMEAIGYLFGVQPPSHSNHMLSGWIDNADLAPTYATYQGHEYATVYTLFAVAANAKYQLETNNGLRVTMDRVKDYEKLNLFDIRSKKYDRVLMYPTQYGPTASLFMNVEDELKLNKDKLEKGEEEEVGDAIRKMVGDMADMVFIQNYLPELRERVMSAYNNAVEYYINMIRDGGALPPGFGVEAVQTHVKMLMSRGVQITANGWFMSHILSLADMIGHIAHSTIMMRTTPGASGYELVFKDNRMKVIHRVADAGNNMQAEEEVNFRIYMDRYDGDSDLVITNSIDDLIKIIYHNAKQRNSLIEKSRIRRVDGENTVVVTDGESSNNINHELSAYMSSFHQRLIYDNKDTEANIATLIRHDISSSFGQKMAAKQDVYIKTGDNTIFENVNKSIVTKSKKRNTIRNAIETVKKLLEIMESKEDMIAISNKIKKHLKEEVEARGDQAKLSKTKIVKGINDLLYGRIEESDLLNKVIRDILDNIERARYSGKQIYKANILIQHLRFFVDSYLSISSASEEKDYNYKDIRVRRMLASAYKEMMLSYAQMGLFAGTPMVEWKTSVIYESRTLNNSRDASTGNISTSSGSFAMAQDMNHKKSKKIKLDKMSPNTTKKNNEMAKDGSVSFEAYTVSAEHSIGELLKILNQDAKVIETNKGRIKRMLREYMPMIIRVANSVILHNAIFGHRGAQDQPAHVLAAEQILNQFHALMVASPNIGIEYIYEQMADSMIEGLATDVNKTEASGTVKLLKDLSGGRIIMDLQAKYNHHGNIITHSYNITDIHNSMIRMILTGNPVNNDNMAILLGGDINDRLSVHAPDVDIHNAVVNYFTSTISLPFTVSMPQPGAAISSNDERLNDMLKESHKFVAGVAVMFDSLRSIQEVAKRSMQPTGNFNHTPFNNEELGVTAIKDASERRVFYSGSASSLELTSSGVVFNPILSKEVGYESIPATKDPLETLGYMIASIDQRTDKLMDSIQKTLRTSEDSRLDEISPENTANLEANLQDAMMGTTHAPSPFTITPNANAQVNANQAVNPFVHAVQTRDDMFDLFNNPMNSRIAFAIGMVNSVIGIQPAGGPVTAVRYDNMRNNQAFLQAMAANMGISVSALQAQLQNDTMAYNIFLAALQHANTRKIVMDIALDSATPYEINEVQLEQVMVAAASVMATVPANVHPDYQNPNTEAYKAIHDIGLMREAMNVINGIIEQTNAEPANANLQLNPTAPIEQVNEYYTGSEFGGHLEAIIDSMYKNIAYNFLESVGMSAGLNDYLIDRIASMLERDMGLHAISRMHSGMMGIGEESNDSSSYAGVHSYLKLLYGGKSLTDDEYMSLFYINKGLMVPENGMHVRLIAEPPDGNIEGSDIAVHDDQINRRYITGRQMSYHEFINLSAMVKDNSDIAEMLRYVFADLTEENQQALSLFISGMAGSADFSTHIKSIIKIGDTAGGAGLVFGTPDNALGGVDPVGSVEMASYVAMIYSRIIRSDQMPLANGMTYNEITNYIMMRIAATSAQAMANANPGHPHSAAILGYINPAIANLNHISAQNGLQALDALIAQEIANTPIADMGDGGIFEGRVNMLAAIYHGAFSLYGGQDMGQAVAARVTSKVVGAIHAFGVLYNDTASGIAWAIATADRALHNTPVDVNNDDRSEQYNASFEAAMGSAFGYATRKDNEYGRIKAEVGKVLTKFRKGIDKKKAPKNFTEMIRRMKKAIMTTSQERTSVQPSIKISINGNPTSEATDGFQQVKTSVQLAAIDETMYKDLHISNRRRTPSMHHTSYINGVYNIAYNKDAVSLRRTKYERFEQSAGERLILNHLAGPGDKEQTKSTINVLAAASSMKVKSRLYKELDPHDHSASPPLWFDVVDTHARRTQNNNLESDKKGRGRLENSVPHAGGMHPGAQSFADQHYNNDHASMTFNLTDVGLLVPPTLDRPSVQNDVAIQYYRALMSEIVNNMLAPDQMTMFKNVMYYLTGATDKLTSVHTDVNNAMQGQRLQENMENLTKVYLGSGAPSISAKVVSVGALAQKHAANIGREDIDHGNEKVMDGTYSKRASEVRVPFDKFASFLSDWAYRRSKDGFLFNMTSISTPGDDYDGDNKRVNVTMNGYYLINSYSSDAMLNATDKIATGVDALDNVHVYDAITLLVEYGFSTQVDQDTINEVLAGVKVDQEEMANIANMVGRVVARMKSMHEDMAGIINAMNALLASGHGTNLNLYDGAINVLNSLIDGRFADVAGGAQAQTFINNVLAASYIMPLMLSDDAIRDAYRAWIQQAGAQPTNDVNTVIAFIEHLRAQGLPDNERHITRIIKSIANAMDRFNGEVVSGIMVDVQSIIMMMSYTYANKATTSVDPDSRNTHENTILDQAAFPSLGFGMNISPVNRSRVARVAKYMPTQLPAAMVKKMGDPSIGIAANMFGGITAITNGFRFARVAYPNGDIAPLKLIEDADVVIEYGQAARVNVSAGIDITVPITQAMTKLFNKMLDASKQAMAYYLSLQGISATATAVMMFGGNLEMAQVFMSNRIVSETLEFIMNDRSILQQLRENTGDALNLDDMHAKMVKIIQAKGNDAMRAILKRMNKESKFRDGKGVKISINAYQDTNQMNSDDVSALVALTAAMAVIGQDLMRIGTIISENQTSSMNDEKTRIATAAMQSSMLKFVHDVPNMDNINETMKSFDGMQLGMSGVGRKLLPIAYGAREITSLGLRKAIMASTLSLQSTLEGFVLDTYERSTGKRAQGDLLKNKDYVKLFNAIHENMRAYTTSLAVMIEVYKLGLPEDNNFNTIRKMASESGDMQTLKIIDGIVKMYGLANELFNDMSIEDGLSDKLISILEEARAVMEDMYDSLNIRKVHPASKESEIISGTEGQMPTPIFSLSKFFTSRIKEVNMNPGLNEAMRHTDEIVGNVAKLLSMNNVIDNSIKHNERSIEKHSNSMRMAIRLGQILFGNTMIAMSHDEFLDLNDTSPGAARRAEAFLMSLISGEYFSDPTFIQDYVDTIGFRMSHTGDDNKGLLNLLRLMVTVRDGASNTDIVSQNNRRLVEARTNIRRLLLKGVKEKFGYVKDTAAGRYVAYNMKLGEGGTRIIPNGSGNPIREHVASGNDKRFSGRTSYVAIKQYAYQDLVNSGVATKYTPGVVEAHPTVHGATSDFRGSLDNEHLTTTGRGRVIRAVYTMSFDKKSTKYEVVSNNAGQMLGDGMFAYVDTRAIERITLESTTRESRKC